LKAQLPFSMDTGLAAHLAIFFESWRHLLRTAVVGGLSYLLLVAILRGAGKKSLARMNVFDSVYAVALGSTLASAVLSPDVTLADAIVAFVVLIGLQMLLRRVARTSDKLENIINGNPTMVFRSGEFLQTEMDRHQTTEEEILAAIRQKGILALRDVAAVVLETDGKFSVLPTSDTEGETSLCDVPAAGGSEAQRHGAGK
jgi:uncharacterized membrane protein YcaP (DUF421 family)